LGDSAPATSGKSCDAVHEPQNVLWKDSTMPATSRPRDAALSHSKIGDSSPGRESVEVDVEADVAQGRQERWLAENQDALESSNRFVELHGLPLSQHRYF
jgi:hypothetical protein